MNAGRRCNRRLALLVVLSALILHMPATAAKKHCVDVDASKVDRWTDGFGSWKVCDGVLHALNLPESVVSVALAAPSGPEPLPNRFQEVTGVNATFNATYIQELGLPSVNGNVTAFAFFHIEGRAAAERAAQVRFANTTFSPATPTKDAGVFAWLESNVLIIVLVGIAVVLVASGFLIYRRREARKEDLARRLMLEQGYGGPPTWPPGMGYSPAPGTVAPPAMPPPYLADRRVTVVSRGPEGNLAFPVDVAPRYQGRSLESLGPGLYRLRNPTVGPTTADFSLGNEDHDVTGLDVVPGGYHLVVAEKEHAVTILVQDAARGRPIEGASVIVQHERAGTRSGRTDAQGKAELRFPRGQAQASLAATGVLLAKAATLAIEPRRKATASLTISVAPPPLADPLEATLSLPGSFGAMPALGEVGKQGLQAFLRVWREVYAEPRLHLQRAKDVERYFPQEVNVALARLQEGLNDLFREKQVQAHLSNRPIAPWQGRLVWRPPLGEAMLDARTPEGELPAEPLARVRASRARVDAALTQAAKTLAIRPGIRLLALADQLLSEAEQRRSLPHLAAADLVLAITDTFLTDPQLAREWAKA